MSVELMVWREGEPVSKETAASTYRAARGTVPDDSADAGVRALADQLPDLVITFPAHALVVMDPEEMDDVSNRVFALAREHGLTVYDPQRDLVHNTAPRCADPTTQLHTGDGMIVVNPDLGLVHDVLGTLSPQNPFAAMVTFGSHFIQVSPGYELEYKEGALRHTLVENLSEVRQAFHEYATGDRAFLDRHTWT